MYPSIFAHLSIPGTNLLNYLYPPQEELSDKPIWIDASKPQRSLSPRQMLSWARRVGFGLDQLQIGLGKVVMVVSPNHIFVPAAFQGVVGAGRIFTAANPASSEAELVYQMRDAEPKIVLVHPDHATKVLNACAQVGLSRNRVFLLSVHPNLPQDGVVDWRFFLGSEEEGKSWKWNDMGETAASTVATLNYSSGTTGLPKGVCISHFNLVANLIQTIFVRSHGTIGQSEERWMGFLPIYHGYGQFYACSMAAKIRSEIYIMEHFDYKKFLSNIQTYRITHLQVPPPILSMLHKRPETSQYNLSSVREILCGAAPLSEGLERIIQQKFNLNTKQGWGMTELTCTASQVPGGHQDATGSVGFLVPNCELKIIDDNHNPVQPDESGEICVRGPNVCLGYWKNDAASRELIDQDGWLHTGDIAILRDNQLYIVDRKKELIKVKGFQVPPAELEACILEHPDVVDVGVVRYLINGSEWPRAYVQLKSHRMQNVSQDQIQAHVKGKLADHKQLVGGVKFVDTIPRLPSGKIQRKVLKEWSKQDARDAEVNMSSRL